MLDMIKQQAEQAVAELIGVAGLTRGSVLVVGCSSSEMMGEHIGKGSSLEAAQAAFAGIYPQLREKGIYLAVQCCEHLNRAIIIEQEAAQRYGYDIVNVVPQPKAGGSFATTAYARFDKPVAIEFVQADAGLDIGDTLIGMHLKRVAVPVRLAVKRIGEANVVAARVRPKFIGGGRAHYDESML